ncbi:22331_t:CDS:2 [Entrophospora sp. SA101]|nr:4716_t:CDS:2 [Entrophospora sp. SA101]CAJ0887949.1 22331_t:CDS:2 [Entrophospora sp. SA101]
MRKTPLTIPLTEAEEDILKELDPGVYQKTFVTNEPRTSVFKEFIDNDRIIGPFEFTNLSGNSCRINSSVLAPRRDNEEKFRA